MNHETTETEIEQRLAEIAAALAAAKPRAGDTPEPVLAGPACPVDPAERDACEACQ